MAILFLAKQLISNNPQITFKICRVSELTTELVNYSWEKKKKNPPEGSSFKPRESSFFAKRWRELFDHLTFVNQPKAVFKSIARDMVYFSKKALKSLLQKPI